MLSVIKRIVKVCFRIGVGFVLAQSMRLLMETKTDMENPDEITVAVVVLIIAFVIVMRPVIEYVSFWKWGHCNKCGGRCIHKGKYYYFHPVDDTSAKPIYQCLDCRREWIANPWGAGWWKVSHPYHFGHI